jgi:membrane fusion protein (multidrug efflux system)
MNNPPRSHREFAADSGTFRHLGSGLAAVACGLALTACQPPKAAPPAPPPPEVVVATVAAERVVLTAELPGRTSPYRIAEIRPQVNGLILKRLFTEGSDIKAGQELYQIDPAPFQTALNNAQAALGRSEASLPALTARAGRFRDLVGEKAVSQQSVDDASAALRQTEADIQFYQAALEHARINLGYTRVVAPIAGRIGSSMVTDGAIVTAYQPVPLATIQQLDPIYVDVPQSTGELLRLQRRLAEGRMTPDAVTRDAVKLLLEDGTAYPQEGTLQFRDVSVDRSTGSVTLRMVFPNPQGVLLPGMFVRARVQEGVNENAILIPQPAVMRDPKGNAFAYVVDAQGTAQPRPLTLDRAIGSQWLVGAGLAPGDRVIVEGLQRIRPGTPVRIAPPARKQN